MNFKPVVRIFCASLVSWALFGACRQKAAHPKNVSEASEVTVARQSQNASDASFFKTYKTAVRLDITYIEGKTIRVQHDIIDSAFLLPQQYDLPEDSVQRKIWHTATLIRIGQEDGTEEKSLLINDSLINKNIPADIPALQEYGVLLLEPAGIWVDKRKLVLDYSYSIPFTDLGKAVVVSVDLTNYELKVSVD